MAANAAPSGKAPSGRVVRSTTAAAHRRAVPRPEDGRSLHPRAAGGRRLGRVPVPDDRSGPDRTAFLTGTQFAPENVAIAHHAIGYAVPPGGAAAVREQDAKTPGLGRQRFGGTGVAGAEVEEGDAAWADTRARMVTTRGSI